MSMDEQTRKAIEEAGKDLATPTLNRKAEPKTSKKIGLFSIVLNDWREQYSRESGLGIVTSVPDLDGLAWVSKIEKDDNGYFIVPIAELRFISKLTLTDKTITNIGIEFEV